MSKKHPRQDETTSSEIIIGSHTKTEEHFKSLNDACVEQAQSENIQRKFKAFEVKESRK